MKKYILIGVIALVAVVGYRSVSGNAFFFLPSTSSATATSSVSYITTSGAAASATTTLDAYANGTARAANSATILVQYVASSTSSVFTSRVEYSQDGVDWYTDSVNVGATTSAAVNLANPRTYTFTAVGTATTSKAFSVATPTRYMRVVHNVAGAAGGVWTQIVPLREVIQ